MQILQIKEGSVKRGASFRCAGTRSSKVQSCLIEQETLRQLKFSELEQQGLWAGVQQNTRAEELSLQRKKDGTNYSPLNISNQLERIKNIFFPSAEDKYKSSIQLFPCSSYCNSTAIHQEGRTDRVQRTANKVSGENWVEWEVFEVRYTRWDSDRW